MSLVKPEEFDDLLEEIVQELETDEISYSFSASDFMVQTTVPLTEEMFREMVEKVIQYVNEGKNHSGYLINRWTVHEAILHYRLPHWVAHSQLTVHASLEKEATQILSLTQVKAASVLNILEESNLFYSFTYEDGSDVHFLRPLSEKVNQMLAHLQSLKQ